MSGALYRKRVAYIVPLVLTALLGMVPFTIVLSIADRSLFRPVDFPDSAQLYRVFRSIGAQKSLVPRLSNFRSWNETATGVTLSLFSPMPPPGVAFPVTEDGKPLKSAWVDAKFFHVLGRGPRLGAIPDDAFRTPVSPVPLLLTHRTWQRDFQGRSDIVGRLLPGYDAPLARFVVVGVLPEGFVFPSAEWIPEVVGPLWFGNTDSDVIAQANLLNVVARTQQSNPTLPSVTPDEGAIFVPLREHLSGTNSAFARLALMAAGVVLLLTCINVATLVFARILSRANEFRTRVALGATRRQLLAHLGVQIWAAHVVAVVIGAIVARLALQLFGRLLPSNPLYSDVSWVDWRVIALLLLVATASTLVTAAVASAVLPRDFATTVHFGFRRRGLSARNTLSLRWLIGLQAAVSVPLVIAGGLVTASLWRVWSQDVGFEVDRTLAVLTDLGNVPPSVRAERARSTMAIFRRLPGVEQVAIFDSSLLGGGVIGSPFRLPQGAKMSGVTGRFPVSPGFFDAAGPKLITGRLPTDEELNRGARVAVVSAKVAQSYWPEGRAVGQILDGRLGAFQVVGVVEDARYRAPDIQPSGEVYVSVFVEGPRRQPTFLLKANGSLAALSASVSNAVLGVNDVRLVRSDPLVELFGQSIMPRRLRATFFGLFAGAALLLLMVGCFGVMAVVVASQIREIGIRSALGSSRAALIRHFVVRQLSPVFIGLATGAVAAIWTSRLLQTTLYGIGTYDFVSWSAAVLFILGASALGCLAPAFGASRVDPMEILRHNA